jgi:hypothetical protein
MRFDNKFVAGYLVAIALTSLGQDAMGKERYLALASTTWVSGWYTVPAAIFVLLLSVWLYTTKEK